MSWCGILGHDDVVARFRVALERGRLASSFLFVGPEGIGKRRFALELARSLLCSSRPEEAMDPCGACPACLQVGSLTHPDLEYVKKPEDKSFLPLELLIGDKEHRGRAGLCPRLSLKPFMGGRKVAIIDDADFLNAEGANCLLKTLEEPPPRSVLILIGTTPAKQLPTIRSRCQPIRFQPLSVSETAEILLSQGVTQDADEAARLAAQSGGSVQRAAELADAALQGVRDAIFRHLSRPPMNCLGLSTEIMRFVEQAGREAPARRERLRQAIAAATEFFEQLLRSLSLAPTQARSIRGIRAPGADEAAGHWRSGVQGAVRCIERCLEAADQVDRNVYPATLVECWIDDLARTAQW